MLLVSSIKGFKPQTNKISCFIGFFPHYRKQRFLLILSNKALSGYRSLPAKLSASYLHAFMSVQHAVSLPPSEAFPKLFPRFRVRPACCIAPSQRSFPQAISTFRVRPACCIASSQRSSARLLWCPASVCFHNESWKMLFGDTCPHRNANDIMMVYDYGCCKCHCIHHFVYCVLHYFSLLSFLPKAPPGWRVQLYIVATLLGPSPFGGGTHKPCLSVDMLCNSVGGLALVNAHDDDILRKYAFAA